MPKVFVFLFWEIILISISFSQEFNSAPESNCSKVDYSINIPFVRKYSSITLDLATVRKLSKKGNYSVNLVNTDVDCQLIPSHVKKFSVHLTSKKVSLFVHNQRLYHLQFYTVLEYLKIFDVQSEMIYVNPIDYENRNFQFFVLNANKDYSLTWFSEYEQSAASPKMYPNYFNNQLTFISHTFKNASKYYKFNFCYFKRKCYTKEFVPYKNYTQGDYAIYDRNMSFFDYRLEMNLYFQSKLPFYVDAGRSHFIRTGYTNYLRFYNISQDKSIYVDYKRSKVGEMFRRVIHLVESPCFAADRLSYKLCMSGRCRAKNRSYQCARGNYVIGACDNSQKFMHHWLCPTAQFPNASSKASPSTVQPTSTETTLSSDVTALKLTSTTGPVSSTVDHNSTDWQESEMRQLNQIISNTSLDSKSLKHFMNKVRQMDEIMKPEYLRSIPEMELEKFGDDSISLVDNFLNTEDSAWQQFMSDSELGAGVISLTQLIEKPFLELAGRRNTKSRVIHSEHINLKIVSAASNMRRISFNTSDATNETVDELGIRIISNLSDPIGVLFVRYNGIAKRFSQQNNFSVVSEIFAASMTKSVAHLEVTFKLYHKKVATKRGRFECGFWVQNNISDGWLWSRDGCEVMESDQLSTSCKCDHLTNFAVLFNYRDIQIPVMHYSVMTLLTRISCCIAILFLALFLFFLSFISNVCPLDQFHLSLNLLIGNLMMLIGSDRTEIVSICRLFAALVQYFFLVAFTWKSIFAWNAARLILVPTRSSANLLEKRKKLFLFTGYTIPLIIVLITFASRYEDYGSTRACWISTENGTIWSFLGPIFFVLLSNTIILLAIAVCLFKNYLDTRKQSEHNTTNTKALLQLTLTMGITWISGFFMFEKYSLIIFGYLFIIFNMLQAVFLFILMVVFNKEHMYQMRQYFSGKLRTSSVYQVKSSSSKNRRISSKSLICRNELHKCHKEVCEFQEQNSKSELSRNDSVDETNTTSLSSAKMQIVEEKSPLNIDNA